LPIHKIGLPWERSSSLRSWGASCRRGYEEADEAHSRRREIERLYKFSQKLLGEGNVIQLMNAIPNYVVESFEAGAAELFLPQKEKFYRSGYGSSHLDEERMKAAFLRDEMIIESQESLYFIPCVSESVRSGVSVFPGRDSRARP